MSNGDGDGIPDHVTAMAKRQTGRYGGGNQVKSGRLLRVLSRTIDLCIMVFYQGGRRRVRALTRRVRETVTARIVGERARACQKRCEKLERARTPPASERFAVVHVFSTQVGGHVFLAFTAHNNYCRGSRRAWGECPRHTYNVKHGHRG